MTVPQLTPVVCDYVFNPHCELNRSNNLEDLSEVVNAIRGKRGNTGH